MKPKIIIIMTVIAIISQPVYSQCSYTLTDGGDDIPGDNFKVLKIHSHCMYNCVHEISKIIEPPFIRLSSRRKM